MSSLERCWLLLYSVVSAGETLSNSLAASGKAVVIAGNIFLAFDNCLLNRQVFMPWTLMGSGWAAVFILTLVLL